MICPAQAVAPVPTPHSSNAAGWFALALAISIIVVEWWLYKSGRPTISQWIRRHTSGPAHHVIRVLFAAGIAALLWHLFLGGPL